MVNIDENETLRILSKNPRGFCFEDGKDDKITAGIEYFHDAKVGAILAQETNTDWKQHKTREKLRNKLFKYWKHQNITTSVSDTKARISTYLPGGTATAILGKWSSRIMATGSDKRQGRWPWERLQGNTDDKGKCINIQLINAYRVCQKQVTDGSFTSYMQQYTVQQSEGNPTPYPRTQVIVDLTKFIQECKDQGDEII